jgi:hypothetical protein
MAQKREKKVLGKNNSGNNYYGTYISSQRVE